MWEKEKIKQIGTYNSIALTHCNALKFGHAQNFVVW